MCDLQKLLTEVCESTRLACLGDVGTNVGWTSIRCMCYPGVGCFILAGTLALSSRAPATSSQPPLGVEVFITKETVSWLANLSHSLGVFCSVCISLTLSPAAQPKGWEVLRGWHHRQSQTSADHDLCGIWRPEVIDGHISQRSPFIWSPVSPTSHNFCPHIVSELS